MDQFLQSMVSVSYIVHSGQQFHAKKIDCFPLDQMDAYFTHRADLLTERLFSEWFLIHKAKCFLEFISHVNYLLWAHFQFCTFPIPCMEKRDRINLVNFFL